MSKTNTKPPTDEEIVMGRIEAIAALENDLVRIEAISASHDDQTGRWGAQRALAAIHRFLVDAEVPRTAHGPLVKLQLALVALEGGDVMPILERPPVSQGNREVTAIEWIPRVIAAAALDIRYRELKKQGEKSALDTAASWVARETRDWPELTFARDLDPGKIENNSKTKNTRIIKWRSAITARPPKDPMFSLFQFLVAKERNWSAKRLLATEPAVWGIKTKKSQ